MSKKIKITESDLVTIIQKLVKEDAGMDTPGGNPDYFYGDGSLDKIRKIADNQEEKESEMTKEEVIQELVAIYSYSQDGATEEVNHALENLLYQLGGFKDDVNESKQTLNEAGDRITQSSMERYMDGALENLDQRRVEDINNILNQMHKRFAGVEDMIVKYNQK